jgi:hypothetical protein
MGEVAASSVQGQTQRARVRLRTRFWIPLFSGSPSSPIWSFCRWATDVTP